MDDGAHTIPAALKLGGLPSLCSRSGRTPILPDIRAAGALRKQPRPEAVCTSLRPEGGAGQRGGSPWSRACHICTYLNLGWWSVLSGMPIAGLDFCDICID